MISTAVLVLNDKLGSAVVLRNDVNAPPSCGRHLRLTQ